MKEYGYIFQIAKCGVLLTSLVFTDGCASCEGWPSVLYVNNVAGHLSLVELLSFWSLWLGVRSGSACAS